IVMGVLSAASSVCASAISGSSFERGRKYVVRVDRAAGGLIEVRQLQRRLQAEAARALLACDGHGGEIGFLGAGGIFGIGLKKDVAADAVQEGVGPTFACLLRRGQRFVDPRHGGGSVSPLGFDLGGNCSPPFFESGR